MVYGLKCSIEGLFRFGEEGDKLLEKYQQATKGAEDQVDIKDKI